jgi:hypothetical protein
VAAPILSPKLGKPVTSRQFSWKEMVIRQWGSEYAAPDHRVYQFSNGRSFDSTDLYTTGIYNKHAGDNAGNWRFGISQFGQDPF